MYAEAVDDEKLRLLAFEDRWHFVALLCCKSTGILDGEDASLRRRKVAVKLGLDMRELDEVARRLEEVGLICAETFQPLAWADRQFESDSAAERMRAYRERTKQKTKRNGDVTVTAQEAEADTEADTEKDKSLLVASAGAADDLTASVIEKARQGPPPCPHDAIVNLYHEILPTLPRVAVLTEQRKGHLQARWRQVWNDERFDQARGLELFGGYFKRVARSKFLTGRATTQGGRKPFVADLAWLVKPENFAKVLEGKYE